MNYPHLAARLFNTPLMARFDTAQTFAAAFDRIVSGEVTPRPSARVTDSGIDAASREGYSITTAGIGVLTIEGPLVQRAGQMTPDCSPITSYQWINSQLMAMAADVKVRAILLEFDTPGGEVANVFELGGRFASVQAKSGKPIWAIANEGAFSAGYALAAGAERILLPSTAMAGSIGVIMLHVDASKAVEKKGYAVTPIFAGARKNDFSPYEPLTREALTIGQARIDELYGVFTEFVAQKRGLELAVVQGTEAGIFNASEAVRLGLADEVATFDEALGMLTDRMRSGSSSLSSTPRQVGATRPQGAHMDKPQGTAPASDTAQPQQPAAPTAAPVDAAKVAADARAAERTRINAIIGNEEAKGREKLAHHLAMNTEMDAEAAISLLKVSPKEVAAAPANALAAAMARVPNPKVGTGADSDGANAGAVKVDVSKFLSVVPGNRAA